MVTYDGSYTVAGDLSLFKSLFVGTIFIIGVLIMLIVLYYGMKYVSNERHNNLNNANYVQPASEEAGNLETVYSVSVDESEPVQSTAEQVSEENSDEEDII